MIAFQAIDLNELAKAVLDGAIGDHDMRDVVTVRGASEIATQQVSARVGRPLNALEIALTYVAVFAEFTRRREHKRADLADTQRRLASPRRRMFSA